jgi:sialate O-acetylesterase
MIKYLIPILVLISPGGLRGELTLPGIFGDSMVLQADMPIPVWGKAAPNQVVDITFGGVTVSGTASDTGDWKVVLPAQKANAVGGAFEAAAPDSKVAFKDVVVGEVWLCSGQSNMEYNLGRAHNGAEEVPKAEDSAIRFFQVKKGSSLAPSKEITGKWLKCTPGSAAGFSAVGYFFGKDIRKELGRPVGLIGSYWGGTPAQAWTSIEGLTKEPGLANFVNEYRENRVQDAANGKNFPAIRKAFDEQMAKWKKEHEPQFIEETQRWAEAAKKARSEGREVPPRPTPAVAQPKVPRPPGGGGGGPGNLFNAMISPLVPYAMRGVIWYQGEANAGRPAEYATLFPALIRDWRAQWQQGDFPFLFVQLARFTSSPVQNWPYLREAQSAALKLPNTGMAVAYDVGDPTDIHPKDKYDVAKRLSAIALRAVYGRENSAAGPIFRSAKISGNTIELSFENTGGGLEIGSAPWVPEGLSPLSKDKLVGFFVSNDKNQWFPANARIEGDMVLVSSPEVTPPVAVRYAWANCPDANLYNKEGFPAAPFRTDEVPYDPKTAR